MASPGRTDARGPADGFVPSWRYSLSRLALRLAVRVYSRFRVEGAEHLPAGPAVLCFNHLNWSDPLFLMAGLPARRVFFFGPEQEDMRTGARNRLMTWAGIAVPYKPGRRGLVAAMRRVEAIAQRGEPLAIAGEGRIHAGEQALLPLQDGPAFIARRVGIPVVPVAINGTGWLGFRRPVRIRVGEPISTRSEGQDDGATAVAALTARISGALAALVADFPDQRPPGPVGRWLTELFNEWPEGARPEPGRQDRSTATPAE